MNSPLAIAITKEENELQVAIDNAMSSKAAPSDCASSSYGNVDKFTGDIPLLSISADFQAHIVVHRSKMNNSVVPITNPKNSDEELVCQRCNEIVLAKKFYSERYFGILRNCDHVFCIRCIKYMWTSEKVPNHPGGLVWRLCCCVCNVYSLNSAASQRWLKTIEEKEAFFRQFMAVTSKMPCMVCYGGEGTCIHGHLYESTYKTYSTRTYDMYGKKFAM